jgi:hypothetical protein
MSSCVTYKDGIPNFGVYEGKAFKFNKTSAGNNKYAYAGVVEINDYTFQIIHDASVTIVVFRNDENDIYERYKVESKVGNQEMILMTMIG